MNWSLACFSHTNLATVVITLLLSFCSSTKPAGGYSLARPFPFCFKGCEVSFSLSLCLSFLKCSNVMVVISITGFALLS